MFVKWILLLQYVSQYYYLIFGSVFLTLALSALENINLDFDIISLNLSCVIKLGIASAAGMFGLVIQQLADMGLIVTAVCNDNIKNRFTT